MVILLLQNRYLILLPLDDNNWSGVPDKEDGYTFNWLLLFSQFITRQEFLVKMLCISIANQFRAHFQAMIQLALTPRLHKTSALEIWPAQSAEKDIFNFVRFWELLWLSWVYPNKCQWLLHGMDQTSYERDKMKHDESVISNFEFMDNKQAKLPSSR